jgi:glycosyltransferase involved in cell wall biosynthesis
MKIAIMMRAMEQDSGHKAIIERLVEDMLRIDETDTYLLLYRTDKWLGRFASYPNAREMVLPAPHKLLWDQVVVPYRAWKEGADIIYNPKFSVPLISSCPVVMGLHEPAWWAWPKHYEWFDRTYMKLMLPLYVKRAAHLFPISKFVIAENRKYMSLPLDKTTVAYPAPMEYFQHVESRSELEEVRARLGLPERFILLVTRVDHAGLDGSHSFFPGKNVEIAVRAFQLCREHIGHHLVIAGRHVRDYLLSVGFSEHDLEGIHFLGFVQHEELPKVLSQADLFVLPSFYESYAMALVEAMACGCPVVASESGACPEIVAGAGLLANPRSADDFADKILRVLRDRRLAISLRARSLQRAAWFSGTRTARAVVGKIREVIAGTRPRGVDPGSGGLLAGCRH